jgi:hypothetical protein
MKTFRLLAFLCLGVFSSDMACANPLRFPQRLIDNRRVDIRPLFQWWSNDTMRNAMVTNTIEDTVIVTNKYPRPLTAWHRIMGTNTVTDAYGWIVNGTFEVNPGEWEPLTFVLRHPPTSDAAKQQNLVRRLAGIASERVSANYTYTNSSALAEHHSKRTVLIRDPGSDLIWFSRDHERLIARHRRNAGNAAEKLRQLDVEEKQVNHQLTRYIRTDYYTIDFFALHTGLSYKGLPVYDLGMLIGSE